MASAEHLGKSLSAATTKDGFNVDAQKLADINALLIESERKLTTAEGLPGRPWFKHQIYAPGAYTGYGVKTLPAVREAMDREDWQLAQDQVPIVAKVIEDEAELIDQMAALVTPASSIQLAQQ